MAENPRERKGGNDYAESGKGPRPSFRTVRAAFTVLVRWGAPLPRPRAGHPEDVLAGPAPSDGPLLVRWAFVEYASGDLTHIGKFPEDEEVMAAARMLTA